MTNDECVGYAIGALYQLLDEENKSFKVKKAYCEELKSKLYRLFDIKTENEADKIYNAILLNENNEEIKKILF
jgi:hypothetical protein